MDLVTYLLRIDTHLQNLTWHMRSQRLQQKMFIFDPLQVPQTGRNHGVPKDHLKGTPYSNIYRN